MNKCFFGLVASCLMALQSCGGNYEKYQGMEDLSWHLQDTVRFIIEKDDRVGVPMVAVKYTEDYNFRNLYIRYILKDSAGNEIKTDLINVPLFESTTGKPLGDGFGRTYTKYDTLHLDTVFHFTQIDFVHYMRVDKLNGIEAMGLRIQE